MKKIYILISDKKSRSGITSYAFLLVDIINKISPGLWVELIDINEFNNITDSELLKSIILAQIGVNDSIVHQEINSRICRAKLNIVFEYHDSPVIINSHFKWTNNCRIYICRAIRKLVGLIFFKLFFWNSFFITDRIIVKSKIAERRFLESAYGSDLLPKNIHYIPIPLYSKRDIIQKKYKSCLGFIGFISPAKGLHVLIEAMGICKSRINESFRVKLIIAGDPAPVTGDSYFKSLLRLIKENNLSDNVQYLGFLPDDQFDNFFSAVDYTILPYINKNTGSTSGPLTLSISHGVPLILSDIPIFKDELKGCGYLIDTANIEKVVELLTMLSLSDSIPTKFIDSIKSQQDTRSWENVFKQYYKIFEEFM